MILDDIIDEWTEMKEQVTSRMVTIQKLNLENKLLRQELAQTRIALENCISQIEKDNLYPKTKRVINVSTLQEKEG